jgi:hypothetical protein
MTNKQEFNTVKELLTKTNTLDCIKFMGEKLNKDGFMGSF